MNESTYPGLTPEEASTAAALLKKLAPGFLPLPIFLETTRLTTLCVIEVVPLRVRDGQIEVLLTERPADDPYFPSQPHTPGTAVLATDTPGDAYPDAFSRIFDDELQGIELAGQPVFVKTLLNKSVRGTEDSKIYYVEVTGESKIGTFHAVDNLPSTIVESQPHFIAAAVTSFKTAQQKGAL